jgi:predicted RNase H-like HicB family nuclease
MKDNQQDWVVEYPLIPGCVSQGNTQDEALQNIQQRLASSGSKASLIN